MEEKKRGNQGWSTRPYSGRPTMEVKRKNHTLRAFDDEWTVIKEFADQVKANTDAKKTSTK